MKRSLFRHNSWHAGGRLLIAAAVLVSSGALASAAAASSLAQKKKPVLSLPTVAFLGSAGAVSLFEWIASGQGYFQKQGLNESFQVSTASGSGLVAAMIAGAAQFEVLSVGVSGVAAQAGAPVRALMQTESSTLQQLAISQSAATKFNIPSASSTPAQAKAQILALKGSHLTFGVANTTSDGYTWFTSLANLYGLTIGPKGDVNLTTLGSSTAQDAAINSGKVDGILQTPPVTSPGIGIQIPFVTVNLNELPPTNVAADYLVTTISMIQQHRDTVQAVLNGMLRAWHFVKTQKRAAEKIVANQLAAFGTSNDPAESETLYNLAANDSNQPFPTKSAYATTARIVSGAISPPLTLPYSSFVNPGFILAASRITGVKLP